MPCGEQHDIECAKQLLAHLGIKHYIVKLNSAVDGLIGALPKNMEVLPQTRTNLPARIRMSVPYAISQSNNGRVANTCNLSEYAES